jgi:hypothetical protein
MARIIAGVSYHSPAMGPSSVSNVTWLGMLVALSLPTVACGPPEPRTPVGIDDGSERPTSDDVEEDDIDATRAERLRVHPAGSLLPFDEHGDFSEQALYRGIKATSEQCARVQAVWVPTTGQHGECLRYWAAGFESHPTRAVVFFPGDAWIGKGKTDKAYLSLTPEKLQQSAEKWSKKLGVAYIHFGRPGMEGSSGDHMQRKRPLESQLISAALDQLVARYQLKELVIAGQSGGGHVTSSLLTLRSDVVCAVPTSAPSSPRIRMQMKGWSKDTNGFTDSYEPTDHLDKTHMNPRLRVFVLESPSDSKVPWQMQTVLADKLNQMGVPAFVLQGDGTGPRHHGLSNSSRVIAGACARDEPSEAIRSRAAQGLHG